MEIEPSGIAGVDLIGPGDADFHTAIALLLGHEADDLILPALPFSVIARNNTSRTIAMSGVRFDMLGGSGKSYSVIHYADALRHAGDADFVAGARRFVCAEPLYTEVVLRRENAVDQRGPMNLANLRRVLRIKASIDCVAFDDGEFAGVDSCGAFGRFERERAAESLFVEELLRAHADIEMLVAAALEDPSRRALARRLYAGWRAGGAEEAILRAHNHRLRIRLWR